MGNSEMPCCPNVMRCLMVGLLSAPLLIGAVACSNSASSTPTSSKTTTQEGSPKVKEPVDPR
jgi:hypothetical protein